MLTLAAMTLVGLAAPAAQAQERDFRDRPHDGRYNRFERLARAAHQFDGKADRFHDLIHRLDGYSHLDRAAHELEEEAGRFHRAAERGANFWELRHDFDHLKDDFRRLEFSYRRAHEVHHNPFVQREWEELSRAFAYLDEVMPGR
jgi:hypothetical protein